MSVGYPSYSMLRTFLDGMLMMMALYALFSYVQQRKAIYWQYALYILCITATFQLDDVDYGQTQYAPGSNYVVVLLETAAFLLYIRFAVLLIDIPRHDPFSHRLLKLMNWLLVGSLVVDTGLYVGRFSDDVRSQLYTIGRFMVAALALVVVPRIFRLRQPVSSYFILGSFFFVMGCILALSLNFIPVLFTRHPSNPFSFPTIYMQVGVVLEVLCFTLGLSRLNQETELDKQRMQAELIEQFQENEKRQRKLQQIRDEIARDLHDELGADLGGIGMLALAASRQVITRPNEAQTTLVTISQAARRVITTMREIVWNLNSAHDTLQNVATRLDETAHSLLEQQAIALHLELPPGWTDTPLPTEYRRDLFLLFKEALHNLIRHSGATEAFISLSIRTVSDTESVINLLVKDNGRGFRQDTVGLGGNGLQSMHQRAATLGGTLTVNSSPGNGTSVQFSGPIAGNPVTRPPNGVDVSEMTE